MAPLTDLPVEILQDNLVPFLPAKELLRLTCTNKAFAALCSDEAIWKRKLVADFNYTGAGTARTNGWKVIYRGLHRPKAFFCRERANGRLGVVDLPKRSVQGVPFPFQLKFPPSTRIVSLAAGGMSFYALDSEGFMHVWGTLDGSTYALDSDGFEDAGKTAYTPHRLLMPSPIRSVSCGRLHASALDSRNRIWNFVNWGRPFSIDSPVLHDLTAPPVQVESGWSFSAVLLASGEIFVWWPFNDPLAHIIQEHRDAIGPDQSKRARANDKREISCLTWDVNSVELTRLPHLPELPTLGDIGNAEDDQPPRIVQIAGLDSRIVGVTDQGHVLAFGRLSDAEDISNSTWEYLPNFSDLNLVRRHKTFADNLAVPPDVMKITHVTGNFRHFVAYSTGSSSLVLIGEDTTTPQSTPDIKPGLQNRSVISVAIGDWHSAALTADGKVLTWGEFSSGALGLGDPAKLAPGTPGGYSANTGRRQARPESVVTPTVVRFDYGTKEPRDRFAFELTAAGWHTGALVMDLDVSVLRLAVGSFDKDHSRMATSFSPLLLCLCSVPP
ncbi:RCC1/BLIP-II [Coprinellus micaceus]|uniref:RCC1/BLIP-II n=1 Tax=Coprinellus micaceus TaxID=71717 RepID=A0A4Y7TS16_COPMI|nr:RCC1/BLIP-II [Coprinellus micaceus]